MKGAQADAVDLAVMSQSLATVGLLLQYIYLKSTTRVSAYAAWMDKKESGRKFVLHL